MRAVLAALSLFGLVGQVARSTRFEPWSECPQQRGEGKRVLITGVTGMLGSHMVEELLDCGYEVHGVVRARSNLRNIASFASRISVVTADLTDSWHTLRVVKAASPHYIYHFAAQAFNGMSFDEPQQTLNTNVMSTLNLLEAVRELGLQKSTRLLVAGSSTVYGASTEFWDGPIPETAPLQPVSPYGVSKATTEMLAMQYARTHGLQVVVPRFFIHLAPRGVEALALHEFARQLALVRRGLQEPVIRHGDLSTLRDITDITDSMPVIRCLAETAPSGTVVNVGSNTSYSVRALLEQAVELSGLPVRLELDRARLRAYDERVVLADISLLRRLTGWIPSPDMPKLIRQLLDYWELEVEFRHARGSRRGNGERASTSTVEL